jgi:hypothetical protein
LHLHGALLIELRHVVFGDAARQAKQEAHRCLRDSRRERALVVRDHDGTRAQRGIHLLHARFARLHPLQIFGSLHCFSAYIAVDDLSVLHLFHKLRGRIANRKLDFGVSRSSLDLLNLGRLELISRHNPE